MIRMLSAIIRGIIAFGTGMAIAIGLYFGVSSMLSDAIPLWLRIGIAAAVIFSIVTEFINGKGTGRNGSRK